MSKLIYKIDKEKPTLDKIAKLQEKGNIFFRFHDPYRRMSSRSKSWGMIYTSEAEALRDGSDVLNGKSCMPEAWELMNWCCEFDNSYVVVAFEGSDTGETGHDGEYVATYYKKVSVWSYNDFCNLFWQNNKTAREIWEEFIY